VDPINRRLPIGKRISHYDVYVNDVLEEARFVSGVSNAIYGQWGDIMIEGDATETAGNRSPPATTTIFF
jgi:hypothetical protein